MLLALPQAEAQLYSLDNSEVVGAGTVVEAAHRSQGRRSL